MNKILTAVVAGTVLLFPFVSFADVSISVLGANPVSVQANTPFVDPGYSANSTNLGDVTSAVSASTVDTSKSGSTQRNYSYGVDIFGDSASASRSITVVPVGGGMIWCSSEFAPGWNKSLPNGGCGAPVVHKYAPSISVHNADGSWSLLVGAMLE